MTTQTQPSKRKSKTPDSGPQTPAPRLFWASRAGYAAGKTRRQRQDQYRSQINVLAGVIIGTLLVGLVFVLANWANAGASKNVSCSVFPEYCVPLAGASAAFPQLEAASSRTLDGEVTAAPGVERYVDPNGIATLGDPTAPVHFVVVSDFACPHCQDYHETDMPRFIKDYVLTGQATFGIVMVTGTGGQYSEIASQAALCAGEQGAFWEMSEELFRLARSMGAINGFSLSQITKSAKQMGLNSSMLLECVSSNRYSNVMRAYSTLANDNGVTGTPSVLASYGDTNQWSMVNRDYASLGQLTAAAQNR